MYAKSTLYVVGTAKLNKSDPILSAHDIFFVGLIIDTQDNKIVDTTCNMVKDKTEQFIDDMLRGYNIVTEMDTIQDTVFQRYHGIAQKALAAAIKDAANKYQMIRAKADA